MPLSWLMTSLGLPLLHFLCLSWFIFWVLNVFNLFNPSAVHKRKILKYSKSEKGYLEKIEINIFNPRMNASLVEVENPLMECAT